MPYVRILLVEDNPADARLLSEYLPRNLPYEIDIAHCRTLDRALRELDRSTRTHLILSDLSLPDSMGVRTVERLRAAAPATPIIVLSGWEDEAEVQRALAAGADDFHNKANLNGLGLAKLLRETIRRVLAGTADELAEGSSG